MAKSPMPGEVKTRLCPPLEPSVAARLYECFVLDVLGKASAVPDTRLVVSYTPAGTRSFFREVAPDAGAYFVQKGEDLGERMAHCFHRLCEPGGAVVIVGTDSPTMPVRCLELAFDALASGRVGVVFGPTSDGGYYLVGMTSPHPEFFRGIRWGTSEVLERSVERAADLGLGWYLLPEWYDVDRPADLAHLKNELLERCAVNPSAPHTTSMLKALVEQGIV